MTSRSQSPTASWVGPAIPGGASSTERHRGCGGPGARWSGPCAALQGGPLIVASLDAPEFYDTGFTKLERDRRGVHGSTAVFPFQFTNGPDNSTPVGGAEFSWQDQRNTLNAPIGIAAGDVHQRDDSEVHVRCC